MNKIRALLPTSERAPEVAGLALLLMLGAFGWAASEYQDQVRWVEHTFQVEKQIGRLWSALLDAETGQRGYLLTGAKPFLDPYNAAVKAAPEEIDELRELTRDNTEQQGSLSELRPLIEERMFLLTATH